MAKVLLLLLLFYIAVTTAYHMNLLQGAMRRRPLTKRCSMSSLFSVRFEDHSDNPPAYLSEASVDALLKKTKKKKLQDLCVQMGLDKEGTKKELFLRLRGEVDCKSVKYYSSSGGDDEPTVMLGGGEQ